MSTQPAEPAQRPAPEGAEPSDTLSDPVSDAAPVDTAPASEPGAVPGTAPAAQPAADPGTAPPVHVTIVLPCYNEQDHVIDEVERITKAMDNSGKSYELLAVDDCSTDATLARLEEAAPRFPHMRIMAFQHNSGSGTVRRIGSQQARGDIVVWTDADMSYPNERIPDLVDILDTDPSVDQVVGARTTEEGTHKLLRVPAKWFIRKVAERLTNSRIPDLNSGLRAFRRDVSLPYLRLLPPGFSCVTTITIAFLSNQHPVHYMPIEYSKRAGKSKFHFTKDAYRYILQVLRMVMYFNPLKVLMPLALWLIGIGLLKGVFDMVVHIGYFANNTIMIFVTGLIIASLALLADLIVRSRGDV